MWAALCTPQSIDWTKISGEHLDEPYIHIVEISVVSRDIPTEVGILRSMGNAIALMLIDTDDSNFSYPDVEIFHREEGKWDFPVLYVTQDHSVMVKSINNQSVDVKVLMRPEMEQGGQTSGMFLTNINNTMLVQDIGHVPRKMYMTIWFFV